MPEVDERQSAWDELLALAPEEAYDDGFHYEDEPENLAVPVTPAARVRAAVRTRNRATEYFQDGPEIRRDPYRVPDPIQPLPVYDEAGSPPATSSAWRHVVEQLMSATPADQLPSVTYYAPGDERYASLLRTSFNFLLRHASRRYSDSSMMRVRRAADRIDGITPDDIATMSDLPFLVVAERRSGYDELTEVKIGGVVGLAVCWPSNDGKTLMAVHTEHRRRKIGTVLMRILREYMYMPRFWVGQTNNIGMRFLASLQTFPIQVNANGAICYGFGDEEEG